MEYVEISIRLRDNKPPTSVNTMPAEFSERFSNIVIDIWKLVEKYNLGFEHIRFNVKEE